MARSIIPDLIAEASDSRSFVRKLGIATAAVCAANTVGLEQADAVTSLEAEILNFALNLEYLESEFYTYAVYGSGIETQAIEVSGVASGVNSTAGGTTINGAKVTFSNGSYFTSALAAEIGADERAHVALLRSALGSAAIAKPNLNINPLGFPISTQNGFLTLARIFEDIGVTAYTGAAGLLTTSSVITTAAQILASEAEHVASLRVNIAGLKIATPIIDRVDLIPPPSGSQSQYLSINAANGLASLRTPGQVLYLAYGNQVGVTQGGFFPNGFNYGPGTPSMFYTSTDRA